jgi:hypothetical protein
VEFDNPNRLPLLLRSRADVKVTKNGVVLPPDTLAVLSGEKSQQSV